MNHKKYTYLFAGAAVIVACSLGFCSIFMQEKLQPEPVPVFVKSEERVAHSTTHSPEKAQKAPFGTNEEERPALEQLNEIAGSKKPEDVFKRYRILAACYHADLESKALIATPLDERDSNKNKEMAMNQHVLKLCQGVSYSDMTHRLDLLESAIKAKVRGAASLYYFEGPFGDSTALKTRPNDPAVVAWKKQAIAQLEAAAEAGDSDTFIDLILIHSLEEITEKDPVKVYIYTIALHGVQELESKAQPYSQKYLAYLRKDLSAAQIVQAEEKAKALIQACCSSSAK